MHEADRGLFDLRRGRTLHVTTGSGHGPDNAILLATVEGLTQQTLEQLRDVDRGPLRLVLTHHRAHAMGLAPKPPAGQVPDRSSGRHTGDVSLGLNGETSPDQIWRLSSGLSPQTAGTYDLRAASDSEIGGLTLARLGQLLPAVVSVPVDRAWARALGEPLTSGAILSVTTAQIEALAGNVQVKVTQVSDGPVPLEEAGDARFVCFREANGILEHVAILIGARGTLAGPGAGACPLGVPHRRSVWQPPMRLRSAAARQPACLRRPRRRGAAVSGAGRAQHRSGEQAPGLRPAAGGTGHR